MKGTYTIRRAEINPGLNLHSEIKYTAAFSCHGDLCFQITLLPTLIPIIFSATFAGGMSVIIIFMRNDITNRGVRHAIRTLQRRVCAIRLSMQRRTDCGQVRNQNKDNTLHGGIDYNHDCKMQTMETKINSVFLCFFMTVCEPCRVRYWWQCI
jgi:hypothetical protein